MTSSPLPSTSKEINLPQSEQPTISPSFSSHMKHMSPLLSWIPVDRMYSSAGRRFLQNDGLDMPASDMKSLGLASEFCNHVDSLRGSDKTIAFIDLTRRIVVDADQGTDRSFHPISARISATNLRIIVRLLTSYR